MILNTRKHINPGHKEEIQNKNEKKTHKDGWENENYHEKCCQHGVQIQQIMSCTKITL